MDGKTRSIFERLIASATKEDLKEMSGLLHERFLLKSNEQNAHAITKLSIGQNVYFTGRRGAKIGGTITKINQTTVTVSVKPLFGSEPELWRVHASHIKPV